MITAVLIATYVACGVGTVYALARWHYNGAEHHREHVMLDLLLWWLVWIIWACDWFARHNLLKELLMHVNDAGARARANTQRRK